MGDSYEKIGNKSDFKDGTLLKVQVKNKDIYVLEEFLDKISPLKEAKKLGAVLIQLPPSFTVNEFFNTEQFLDRLPTDYEYALEFRHPSWETEGPWNMLKHYNIAAVMTDSPMEDKLQFLSEVIDTANHSFIRWHGRKSHHRYNYLYSKEELKPWVGKIRKIQSETAIVRGHFNNHCGAKAVVNAIQFREMIGDTLSGKEEKVLEVAQSYWSQQNMKLTSLTG